MEVLQERCCGLDVHKRRITACVITPQGKEIRTFGMIVKWTKRPLYPHSNKSIAIKF